MKKALQEQKIIRVPFCSIEMDGAKCAESIEKYYMAQVRGIRADKKEKTSGNCVMCGKKAKEVVYIARSY